MSKEWTNWSDFLGTGKLSTHAKKKKTDKKVKAVLDEIKTNWKFYSRWTDGLIRNWFDEEGLFALNDPYLRSFFTNFTDLRKTVEGKRALMYWLKTKNFRKSYGGFSLGETRVLAQVPPARKFKDRNRLRKPIQDEEVDVQKLLEEIRSIKLTIKDKNDPKVVYTKQLIWRSVFDPSKEKSQVNKIKKEKLNGNKFHDTIVISFLQEYNAVKKLQIHDDWISPEVPNLMQRFVAWKLHGTNGFFNLSNQGSGKTLSGVLSSLSMNSKYTLVICPNNIVNQWKEVIETTVYRAIVSTKGELHPYKYNRHNFHIINYNRFSTPKSAEIVKNVNSQHYDFVIIDETQNMKVKDIRTTSKRRVQIMTLLRRMTLKNKDLKKLCLTATPLINNVKEGKSMLQVITNEKFNEIGNLNTVREASKLHAKFLLYSVRYLKKYKIKEIGRSNYIKVKAEIPNDISNEDVEKLTFLQLEQIAVHGKMKEIIKRVSGQTIIYTEWVTGITDYIQMELARKNISSVVFTGRQSPEEKDEAVNSFLNGYAQVLIASSTIAEGFDSLQTVCSNMIFASLPFTFARYEHVIHRIIRNKQISKQVKIHILSADIGFYDKKKKWHGFEYDQRVKLNRLEFKKGMAVCVTDGTLPEKISLPKSKIKKQILEKIIAVRYSMIPRKSIAKKIVSVGKLRWKI